VGARWIISQAGDVDPVWDRTDAIGPNHRRRELLEHGELSRSDDARVTLYEDEVVTVIANPRRSYGATSTSVPGSRPTSPQAIPNPPDRSRAERSLRQAALATGAEPELPPTSRPARWDPVVRQRVPAATSLPPQRSDRPDATLPVCTDRHHRHRRP
jgi:hypothetical protein